MKTPRYFSNLSGTLLLVFTLFYITCYSQKIDVKKDVILKDKAAYGKISGSIGIFKPADLLVSSLNGDSLFTIKTWKYPTDNPMFDSLSGFKVRFVISGTEMIKSSKDYLVSKERVLEFLLLDKKLVGYKTVFGYSRDLIVNNMIDPEVEQELVAKFDNQAAIKWAQDYEAKEIEVLNSMFPLKRNRNQPFSLKSSPAQQLSGGYIQKFEIYQDNSHLGTIVKKGELSSTANVFTYAFHRDLSDPFSVGEKEISRLMIATSRLDGGPSIKMFVNSRGKEMDIKINNPASAEHELTDILIKNGFL